jgi:hypothetical protein
MEVEVHNQSDIKKYVEFYGIELDELVAVFPAFLPYSIMVKDINDTIKVCIDEIYSYCKNLFKDDNDFLYFSIDKLICNIIEFLKSYFTTETQMGIPQTAVVCNNIEYL